MSDPSPGVPASPSARRLATPSWLDTRLVLGVLLVLVSVVVGARVLAGADRTQLVWAADRDLPAGTVLREDDLRPAEVRLLETGSRYLAAPDRGFVGYVLDRPVERGELLPREAVLEPGPRVDLRFVSVPVLPGRYPEGLERGHRVDVWATDDPEGELSGGSRLVLEAVPVSTPPDAGGALGGGSPERSAVLMVPPDAVADLVEAMSSGRIDLVRVPSRPQARDALRSADVLPRGAG